MVRSDGIEDDRFRAADVAPGLLQLRRLQGQPGGKGIRDRRSGRPVRRVRQTEAAVILVPAATLVSDADSRIRC